MLRSAHEKSWKIHSSSCHGLVYWSADIPRIFRFPKAKNYSTALPRRRRWPNRILAFTAGVVTGSVTYSLLQKKQTLSTLDPVTFSAYILHSKEQISSTSSIFTLIPASKSAGNDVYDRAWKDGVWSVQIRQPQLQIARAYTPLPPIAEYEDASMKGALRFLIRRDHKGEVSRYLHWLPQGATIELRGPHTEYPLPEDVDEVLFIAGGTGIAPALQVAHSLYRVKKESNVVPRMHILWASRRREDCSGGISDTPPRTSSSLRGWASMFASTTASSTSSTESEANTLSPLVQQLQEFKLSHATHISVDYFVDEERSFIDQKVLQRQLQSNSDTTKSELKGKKMILVSGPDGFVQYLAGPKVWQNGNEAQGPLGGLLGEIDHSEWEVWKL